MSLETFAGFMPVSFIFDHHGASERHFFVKQHEGSSETKPSDKTLFVLNVPQFIKKKTIKYMYTDCGEIERVYFHLKPKDSEDQKNESVFSVSESAKGYKVAYIVFKSQEGLKKALKCKELPPISFSEISVSCGLKKWAKEYNSNFIDINLAQKEIDQFMAEYDTKVEEEKQKAKEVESVADEDGWITVTKHSKQPKISREEVVTNRIIARQKRADARKTLLNFYRCQLRESKMEHILELRKKFEKDKERIAQMRANRKFKPF